MSLRNLIQKASHAIFTCTVVLLIPFVLSCTGPKTLVVADPAPKSGTLCKDIEAQLDQAQFEKSNSEKCCANGIETSQIESARQSARMNNLMKKNAELTQGHCLNTATLMKRMDRLIFRNAELALDNDPALTLDWLRQLSPFADGIAAWTYLAEAKRRGVSLKIDDMDFDRNYEERVTVGEVAFASRGRVLAAVANGRLSLIDIKKGKSHTFWSEHDGCSCSEDFIGRLALSPDGRRMASVSRSIVSESKYARMNVLRLWSRSTKNDHVSMKSKILIEDNDVRISAITFSKDVQTLAVAIYKADPRRPHANSNSADNNKNSQIQLWDVKTGRRRKVLFLEDRTYLRGAKTYVTHMAFTKAGRQLALVIENTMRFVSIVNGKTLEEFTLWDSTETIHSMAFSSDSKLFAWSKGDGQIHIWDLRKRKELGTPKTCYAKQGTLSFSHDGKHLAFAGRRSPVCIWEVNKEIPVIVLSNGHDGDVNDVSFSADGKTLATSGKDGTVRLWDIASSGKPMRTYVGEHDSSATALSFSSDGKKIVVTEENAIRAWDVASGREQIVLKEKVSPEAVVVSRGARVVKSIKSVNEARLWNEQSGQLFSPSEKLMAIKGRKSVELKDTAAQDSVGHFVQLDEQSYINDICFSSDSSLLGISSDGPTGINIWNTETKKLVVASHRGNPGDLCARHIYCQPDEMAFSPQTEKGQNVLVWADNFSQVHFLDVEQNRQLDEPLQMSDFIRSMTISSDGRLLALGIQNKISLFDMHTRERLGYPLVHRDKRSNSVFKKIAFSPDGKMIATSFNNEVWLWNFRQATLSDVLREVDRLVPEIHEN